MTNMPRVDMAWIVPETAESQAKKPARVEAPVVTPPAWLRCLLRDETPRKPAAPFIIEMNAVSLPACSRLASQEGASGERLLECGSGQGKR